MIEGQGVFKQKLRSHKKLPLITVTALIIVVFNDKTGGLLNGWKDCD